MMLVGGVLNANTVLQPQFTQQLLGYTATTAGLALTAGGVTLLFMMPLAGFATGKISARTLAACRFHDLGSLSAMRPRSPRCR
jgi:DHA2 family multidrug resistance protein